METQKKYRPFTKEEFVKALKARYREAFNEDDIEGAYQEAIGKEQSLKEAVVDLIDIYVKADGHNRFLILTPDEIRQRSESEARQAYVGAVIALLRKGPAPASEIKTAVRFQVSLRKLSLNSDLISSDIVAALTVAKLVTSREDRSKRMLFWELVKNNGKPVIDSLSKDEYGQFCQNPFEIYQIREQRHRHHRNSSSDESNHEETRDYV